jgi:hypothetical protein
MDQNDQDDQLNDSFNGEFPPQESPNSSGLDSSSDAETLQIKRRTASPFMVAGWCPLKPHCIRCSHFKVDDVSALEPSSKSPVRIVEDNVTASLHQQRTP